MLHLIITNLTGGPINITFQWGPGNHMGIPFVANNGVVHVPHQAGTLTINDGVHHLVSHYGGAANNADVTFAAPAGLHVNYY